MSSHIYTLTELIDLALQTPEVGAVNFNILRIVLQKILSELHLENKTAEWKPVETITPVSAALEEKSLPDHPFLAKGKTTKTVKDKGRKPEKDRERITEKDQQKRTDKDKEEKREQGEEIEREKDKEGKSDRPVSTSEEKEFEEDTSKKTVRRIDISAKGAVVMPEASETSTEIESSEDSEEEDIPEPPKRVHKVKKVRAEKVRVDPSTSSKGRAAGATLWKLWQEKKTMKRVEAIEEELNTLVETVDELKEQKDSRWKRTKFEEGERMQRGKGIVGRDEFEDTIDELGEALTNVAIKAREHKEECDSVNEAILNELSFKASRDDLAKNKEPIDKKLRTIALAVRNIQKLIKDVIFPEACGVTKCMCCGRNAHLQFRQLLNEANEITKKRKSQEGNGRFKEEKDGGVPPGDLKFTNTLLGRLKDQKSVDRFDEKIPYEGSKDDDRETLPDSKYLVELQPLCDAADLTRNFAPLRLFPDLKRRNTISVPVIRPKQAPVSVSVFGNETSRMYTKREVC